MLFLYLPATQLSRVCPASYCGHPSLSDFHKQVLQARRNGNVLHRTSHMTVMMIMMMMMMMMIFDNGK